MIKVGDKIVTWFSGRADQKSTVIEVLPYTGKYKEFFNCVLKLTSSNRKGWTEMSYWDEDLAKPEVPKNYFVESATVCFAKCYNGEGSYYCPDCNSNEGSVWLNDNFRPNKWKALCYNCRNKYREVLRAPMD